MTLQPALHESVIREGTTSLSRPAVGRDHAPRYVITASGTLSVVGTSSTMPTKLWGGAVRPQPLPDRMWVELGRDGDPNPSRAGGDAEVHLRTASDLRSDLASTRSAVGGFRVVASTTGPVESP